MPRWVMVIDLEKCNGCAGCAVNCSQFNHLPLEYRWRQVAAAEVRSEQMPQRLFLSMSCMHCAEPPCLDVCPTAATKKRADGIVDIDPQRCMGCGYCVVACPYLARTIVPNRGTGGGSDGSPADIEGTCTKCDFCLPRVQA